MIEPSERTPVPPEKSKYPVIDEAAKRDIERKIEILRRKADLAEMMPDRRGGTLFGVRDGVEL